MQYSTKSEKDTRNLGKNFAKKLKGGEVFLLTGELGGGKTQFVKGLAEGLGIKENVTSPTFTYEKIYKNPRGLNLYHFDLYREEVLDEDIKELFLEAVSKENVVVVEWAERAKEIWPKKYILLNFKWMDENERKITVTEK